ncbi:MAG: pyruvate kinase alpha/beta domain-containing protein [Candidatus Bathyarchaeia archaeon]|nr:pyruvate kinase alpha/beta domain-containing protein [Candidatus Bathyarchaeia archaeon]
MRTVERKTVYFKEAGKQNTDVLLRVVKEYVEKEGIKDIVVASTTGETGAEASKIFKKYNVVIVTHCFGFRELGKIELQEGNKKEILANGAKIFTGTHALSSVERAVRKDFGTIQPLEIIANTLRLMGEGTKVCVEITLMAADAGLIPVDRDIIAIAGTGMGADTALRLRPANTARFFDLKIREVIAKSYDP